MADRNESTSLPATAWSVVEGLARGVSDSFRDKQGHFYQLYAMPLSRYLQRRFELTAEAADDVVHDFLNRRLLSPKPIDSVAGKYLRRLGMTFVSHDDVSLSQLGLPSSVINYLAKMGAAKLAGEKRIELTPPEDFDQSMIKVGADHFAEIRRNVTSRSFRGYLLKALFYFAVDEQRKKARHHHLGEAFSPIEPVPEPDEHDEAAMLLGQFVTIFRKAISQCRTSAKNCAVHWDIFDAYIVRPALSAEPQPSMGEIAIRFREAIIQSAAGDGRANEWNDDQLEKAARNRLDAIRRTLWQEVDRLIESEIPESLRPDLREAVGSRGRNELLKHYFRHCQEVPAVMNDSDAPFASYLSKFLDEERPDEVGASTPDNLRRDWLQVISQPLHVTLAELEVPHALKYRGSVEYEGAPFFNLEQCFRHPSPPADLLVAIKDSTKSMGKRTSTARKYPMEFAMALYALSVSLMHCRYGKWISSKSAAQFEQVFRTVMSFDWLDDTSRTLIRHSLSDEPDATASGAKRTT